MANRTNSYHHLNLREDLVRAGCAFVAEHGHEELSVRMLAKQVGVSAGAPYHHFADRRALLIAIALEGYRQLTAIGDEPGVDALTAERRLFLMCRNFLNFAASAPRLFTLMYESELTRPVVDPQLAHAQRKGYELIRQAVVEYRGGRKDEDIGVMIATLWSAIYGFALLRSRAMIQPDNEIIDPASEDLADAIVRNAIRLVRDL